MYCVTDGGWFVVNRDGRLTLASGDAGIAEAVWFEDMGDAIVIAQRWRSASVMMLVMSIAGQPRREPRVVICGAGCFLAFDPLSTRYVWRQYVDGIVIGPDAALFNSEDAADQMLKQLRAEGRSSVGGVESVLVTVSI